AADAGRGDMRVLWAVHGRGPAARAEARGRVRGAWVRGPEGPDRPRRAQRLIATAGAGLLPGPTLPQAPPRAQFVRPRGVYRAVAEGVHFQRGGSNHAETSGHAAAAVEPGVLPQTREVAPDQVV